MRSPTLTARKNLPDVATGFVDSSELASVRSSISFVSSSFPNAFDMAYAMAQAAQDDEKNRVSRTTSFVTRRAWNAMRAKYRDKAKRTPAFKRSKSKNFENYL